MPQRALAAIQQRAREVIEGALAVLLFTAVAFQPRLVVVRPLGTDIVALTVGTLEWAIFPPQRMDIGLTRFGVKEVVEMQHNRHGECLLGSRVQLRIGSEILSLRLSF